MVNKAVRSLQLAMAAGKAVSGDGLIPAIQTGRARLVVYNDASGANRTKKLKDKCTYYHVPLYAMPAAEFDTITSRAIMALAVTDAGLAAKCEEELRKDR